jgi:soluble lytic murein transglycosylase-like protein
MEVPMKPASARPGVSRLRRNPEHVRHTASVALAAGALAALTAAAPFLQQADDSPLAAAPPARRGGQAIPARLDVRPLTATAETLASVVARRYRIALASAREVVETAYREGRRNSVDPLLILAVIAVESRFNPIAESEQGAVGLMQIVPRFHADKLAEIGASSVLPPPANIALGARILRESIERGGGETAGLQLYNGSPDDGTKAYANRVQTERRRLEAALPRARDRA